MADEKKAPDTAKVGVFVVHGGKDFYCAWEDLPTQVEAHLLSDVDLKAAAETAFELKAGSLSSADVKRPSTGRVLISSRASLG